MKKEINPLFFVLLLFLAILSFSLILWITANGIGVEPDSITYISVAKSVLAGKGFYVNNYPMTHYPPMYPLLLSIIGFFGGELIQSARIFHSFLYAINVILFFLSIYVCVNGNFLGTLSGLLLLISSTSILIAHSYALSEPLFITLTLLSLLLISKYINTKKILFLTVGSATLGVAVVTRYVGISLIAPIALSLLLLKNRPAKKRFFDTFLFSLISLFPLGIWIVRNILIADSATNRVFIFHPIGLENIKDLIVGLFNFFIPISINRWIIGYIFLIAIFLIMVMLIIMIRKSGKCSFISFDNILPFLTLLSAIFYIGFIFLSKSFFDESIPIIDRILLPSYIFITISLIHFILSFADTFKKPIVWYIFILCLLFSIIVNAIKTSEEAIDMHMNGIFYNSRYWNESDTLELIESIDDSKMIFSNGNDVIQFKTGRDAYRIPALYNSNSLILNKDFQDQINILCARVNDGKAVIVYFEGINWRYYLPDEKVLLFECDLPIMFDTEDGTIYGLNSR